MNGIVKFYNPKDCYGFALSSDGDEYFFHLNDIACDELPQKDDFVTFTPTKNRKGRKAEAVSIEFLPEQSEDEPEPSRSVPPMLTGLVAGSASGVIAAAIVVWAIVI